MYNVINTKAPTNYRLPGVAKDTNGWDLQSIRTYTEQTSVGSDVVETLPPRSWQHIMQLSYSTFAQTATTYDPSILECNKGEALGVEVTIHYDFDVVATWGSPSNPIYCMNMVGSICGFFKTWSVQPYNFPYLLDQHGKTFKVSFFPGTTDNNSNYTYDTLYSPLRAFGTSSANPFWMRLANIISPISGMWGNHPGEISLNMYHRLNSLTGEDEIVGNLGFYSNDSPPYVYEPSASVTIDIYKYTVTPSNN